MARLFEYYADRSLSALAYDFLENSLVLAGKSGISGDIDFYCELARPLAGPVLEVGTGTGRVAWALAGKGHEVVGIDLSNAMLMQAEAKRTRHSEAVGARVCFLRQDMTQLNLGRTFPLVLVSFRTFNHLLDHDRQCAALAALRRHMDPDGVLVLHTIEPSEELVSGGGSTGPDEGTLTIAHPSNGQALHYRVVERRADPVRQTITNVVNYRVTGADGATLAETREILAYRWGTQQELRCLFERSGLVVSALHGDFTGGEPGPGKEQIWMLRRAECRQGVA